MNGIMNGRVNGKVNWKVKGKVNGKVNWKVNIKRNSRWDSLMSACRTRHSCRVQLLVLSEKFFVSMINKDHILHDLYEKTLKYSGKFLVPLCKTERRKKSFIAYMYIYKNLQFVFSKCTIVYLSLF